MLEYFAQIAVAASSCCSCYSVCTFLQHASAFHALSCFIHVFFFVVDSRKGSQTKPRWLSKCKRHTRICTSSVYPLDLIWWMVAWVLSSVLVPGGIVSSHNAGQTIAVLSNDRYTSTIYQSEIYFINTKTKLAYCTSAALRG